MIFGFTDREARNREAKKTDRRKKQSVKAVAS
jgi:hypothetical protein